MVGITDGLKLVLFVAGHHRSCVPSTCRMLKRSLLAPSSYMPMLFAASDTLIFDPRNLDVVHRAAFAEHYAGGVLKHWRSVCFRLVLGDRAKTKLVPPCAASGLFAACALEIMDEQRPESRPVTAAAGRMHGQYLRCGGIGPHGEVHPPAHRVVRRPRDAEEPALR